MTTESMLNAGAENTDAASTATAAGTPAGGTPTTDATAATQQAGTDAKADEGKTAEAEGKPGSDAKSDAEGAPEAYEDFTTPEGVKLDGLADDFKGLAKELGLSQEKAQKVVDAAAKLTQAGFAAQAETVKTINAEWCAETKADKEFGGEKLAENLAKANAAMKATASEKLQTLLDRTGLGNNPEVIRHFLKIAPAFAEDKHVTGGKAPAGTSQSTAKVLYPNNA